MKKREKPFLTPEARQTASDRADQCLEGGEAEWKNLQGQNPDYIEKLMAETTMMVIKPQKRENLIHPPLKNQNPTKIKLIVCVLKRLSDP